MDSDRTLAADPSAPSQGRTALEVGQAVDGRHLLRAAHWLSVEGPSQGVGRPSTVHDRYQLWRKAGVFERLWRQGLQEYDALEGIDWEWQSLDEAMTKAPLGGRGYGSQPHR